jgi:hypothetical protein
VQFVMQPAVLSRQQNQRDAACRRQSDCEFDQHDARVTVGPFPGDNGTIGRSTAAGLA